MFVDDNNSHDVPRLFRIAAQYVGNRIVRGPHITLHTEVELRTSSHSLGAPSCSHRKGCFTALYSAPATISDKKVFSVCLGLEIKPHYRYCLSSGNSSDTESMQIFEFLVKISVSRCQIFPWMNWWWLE